jgi:hypothetical protein
MPGLASKETAALGAAEVGLGREGGPDVGESAGHPARGRADRHRSRAEPVAREAEQP